MLGNDYSSQTCSIAGALEVVGERWSLLIVRDVFLGLRRFDQIQANLGSPATCCRRASSAWSSRACSNAASTRSARRATSTA